MKKDIARGVYIISDAEIGVWNMNVDIWQKMYEKVECDAVCDDYWKLLT